MVLDVTGDSAWRPEIPQGHTSYSWTGVIGLPIYKNPIDKKAPALKKPTTADAKVEVIEKPLFSRLDIRVGEIVSAELHPGADALYVEKIDVGEESPRTIVSGLVKFIPIDEFIGSKCLVIANLKPSKLRGVESAGMVLCACNGDKSVVELVLPPAGAKNGERVCLPDLDVTAHTPDVNVNPKKKSNCWTQISDSLKTNGDCVATYDGSILTTSAGPCAARTLAYAILS